MPSNLVVTDLVPPGDVLALVEDVGSVATWVWDLRRERILGSRGLYRLLGVDSTIDLTFDLYERFIHPDDRIVHDRPANLLASHAAGEQRFRILRPDGTIRWIRSVARMVHKPDGSPSHMLGVAFDISEVVRGHAAAQREDGVLAAVRALFDGIVWTTEADGTIVDITSWRAAVGQHGADHTGWGRLDDIHPDDRQMVKDAWGEALRNGRSYQATFRAMWKGTYHLLSSRAYSIRDALGDVLGWLGYSTVMPLEPEPEDAPPLTPAEIRAARGYLDWSATLLAERAGVSFSTVRRAEGTGDGGGVRKRALASIRRALEQAGIRFSTAPHGRRCIGFVGP